MVKKKNKKIISATIKSWGRYWQSRPAESLGCLPEVPAAVSNLIENIWRNFFSGLSPDTRVLDLGTGLGAVLKYARSLREDLRLTGVDYAAISPDITTGIEFLPQVMMENMPFRNNSFGAVCSQFGVEYATFPEVIEEIKRVAAEEAVFLFLCHHAQGIVVLQNTARGELLKEFLRPNGLLDKACKVSRYGSKKGIEGQRKLGCIVEKIHRKFPGQPALLNEMAAKVATIIRTAKNTSKLRGLRYDIEMEVERISALQKAALTDEKALYIAEELAAGSRGRGDIIVHYVPETVIPFAWQISSSNCKM